MIRNSTNHIFLLIITLTITPFILFLANNFLQIEFFTAKYFWVTFFYCLPFICAATGLLFFKKSLLLVLFFAYISFLQFYFFDIQQFFKIYKGGITAFYVLSFIILLSFIAAFISRLSIFRNFVLILLFLNITLSVTKLIPAIGNSLLMTFKNTNIIDDSPNITSLTQTKYPNIFYIVPDGLASPKILKDYADIDFQDSIKNFEEKGFTVPKHNYSSYNTTYLSLAALFKMDYPATEKSSIYKNRSNFYPTIREKNPEILQYLKKNNYKFVIAPPLWGGCPKSREYRCLIPVSNSFLVKIYQDYSVTTMFQYSLIKKIFNRYNLKFGEDMNDSGKTALKHMKINSKLWSKGGMFTMIHMMMPHSPYREENCSISDSPDPSKEGYTTSVYCSLNRIHELSDFIITNYPNASIVVQSDHGLYFNDDSVNKKFVEISKSKSLLDHRFGAFTAVRGCNSNQAAKLNQTNIVQYIVECLSDSTPAKQFQNKSFFSFYENHPEFGKVFRVHQK